MKTKINIQKGDRDIRDIIEIHYVADNSVIPQKGFHHAHTHGMEKYGHFNLCIPYYRNEKCVGEVLNTVADWILSEPNTFEFRGTHYCDKENGKNKWKVAFGLIKCCGEICWLVNILDKKGTPETTWVMDMDDDLEFLNEGEMKFVADRMGWQS